MENDFILPGKMQASIEALVHETKLSSYNPQGRALAVPPWLSGYLSGTNVHQNR
jgi:hypothetical protein